MKFSTINDNIQRGLEEVLEQYPMIKIIALQIKHTNGRTLLVGGAVRDLVLGLDIKDIDIEVHGLTIEQLEDILQNFGMVNRVGKSFGVLKLEHLPIDWALPRIDEPGRHPKVEVDPHLSISQAFIRRDLTMNAMGIDLVTNEFIDPFNGIDDIDHGILRTPDIHFFIQDPLRFYRVMQFIGRFEMIPDAQLNEICATMDIKTVSRERIELEFEKLLLKSHRPSLGIRWLEHINRLEHVLPELAATVYVEQEPNWHPEGHVFEHSMQALDAAAQIHYFDKDLNLIVRYAALCHDLGKVETTVKIDGVVRSFGHDQAGVSLSKKLLKRITGNKKIIESVGKLVKYHMLPFQFVDDHAGLSAYKRLARKLAPDLNLLILADLARADKRGRNSHGHEPLPNHFKSLEIFLERAEKAQVHERPEEPILLGRDLLEYIKPGPELGKLVQRAYEIQIQEGIQNKEELLRRVLHDR